GVEAARSAPMRVRDGVAEARLGAGQLAVGGQGRTCLSQGRSVFDNGNHCHILASMARNEVRPVIKLRSTAGTGYTYVTRKNRRNDPDRLVLRKYDPIARRHVDFREER